MAAVGRKHEENGLFDVVEDRAALAHRGGYRGEIVVGEHHLGGLFRHLGSLDPHRDADIGLLERGRVVHAVAGHGNNLAVGLHCPDESQLVLRARAGEHIDAAGFRLEGVVVHLLDLRSGDIGLAVADP